MSTTIGFRRRVAKQLQRQADLTPETLIVALDLGKRQHAVWVTDPTRVPLATWTIPNTPAGFTDLLRQTADLSAQSEHPHVLFAMEPTSYFWKLAAQQLADHGARYRLVHPLSVRRARDERRYTWAKGDRIDAELIASLVAQGTWLEKQLEQAHDPIRAGNSSHRGGFDKTFMGCLKNMVGGAGFEPATSSV
jgi:transposase